MLIGTADEIVAAVAAHERRWGVTRFVVRVDAVAALAPFLPRLAENDWTSSTLEIGHWDP